MLKYSLFELLRWLSYSSRCMLVASSSRFCLRQFLHWFFWTSLAFTLSIIVCFIVIHSCKYLRNLNWYTAHLLSCENHTELCLFAGLSSNIFRGPSRSENDRPLCMWDELKWRVSFFSKHSIVYLWCSRRASTRYNKPSHTQQFARSRNFWDNEPTFGDQERLAFYTEAGITNCIFFCFFFHLV